jgi:uncharacterized protein HemX
MLPVLLTILLVAAGLAACLFLFVTVKIEMLRRDRQLRGVLENALTASAAQMEQLEARLAELEQDLRGLEQSAASPTPRPGINLTTRSQVLRRARTGEDPAQIASALGLPRTEVDLLLKVDRVAMDRV